MKEGWQIKKLEELCEYHKEQGVYHNFPYVGMEDIESGTGKLLSTTDSTLIKSTSFHFHKGDVLYGRLRPYLKKSFVADFEGCCSTEIFPIRTNCVYPYYLMYWLISNQTTEKLNKSCGGCRMPRANMNEALKFTIPVPLLSDQQRIVDILDREFAKIDAVKSNAEQALQNAKDLFQALLSEIFSNPLWKREKVSDIARTGAGGTPLKQFKDYYEGGTIPWIRSGEVCTENIYSSEMFINQKGMENSSAKLFPKDTVLVAMYGATAGQVGILRFESTTNQAVCGVLPNKNYLPEFVYYALLNCKESLVAQAVGGAQPNISQIKIKNTVIPFPSLDKQTMTVQKLDSFSGICRKVESNTQQIIAQCEALKQALLSKAFNGEL
jgi:type I restriction enzyme S subunit